MPTPRSRRTARRKRIIARQREEAKNADTCPQCGKDIATPQQRAATSRWCDQRTCPLSRDPDVGSKSAATIDPKAKRAPAKPKRKRKPAKPKTKTDK